MSPPASSHPWIDRARLPARAGYLLILLIATLIPFKLEFVPHLIKERMIRAVQPYISSMDVIDGARNVVLFAGWGVVWAMTSVGNAWRVVKWATLTGAMISISVETAQLMASNRKASILDVTTNTVGSFLGAVGLILLIYLARERRGARSFVGIPTMLIAASYASATFFEAFSPLFRQTMIRGAGGGPFNRLEIALGVMSSQSLLEVNWSDLLLFAPTGFLLLAAFTELGHSYRAAFWRTVIGGWILSAGAELLHGGLGQEVDPGSVLLHGFAIMLGAGIAWRVLPRLTVLLRGRERVLALMLVYAACLAVWAWRPLIPETTLHVMAEKFRSDWWKPMAALSGRNDMFTVVDVLNQFLLYLPLGALLSVWPLRRRGWLSGPLPAAWLALVLESSQIFIEGRMLDVTDFLIMSAGAAIGWAVVRRAGFPVYGELGPTIAGSKK